MGKGDRPGSALRNSGGGGGGGGGKQQQRGGRSGSRGGGRGGGGGGQRGGQREGLKGQDKKRQQGDKKGDKKYQGGKNSKIHGDKGNFTLLLTGFGKAEAPDSGHLVEFLSKQGNGGRPIRVCSSEFLEREKKLFLVVETHAEALSLVKLGKTKYFGSPLTIRSIPSRSVGPRMELFPVFREALKPLYQAQARLLNLRQLHSVVHEQNSALSHPGALLALLLVVVEAYPSVKSLDLSDNGISSLAPFKDVLLPELANICLENNRISSFSELDHLKALRVQNLILLGNPLHHKEPMEYKSEVLRRFPALRWLDRGQVAPVMPLPVELASACSFPKLKGNFCGVPGRQAEVARFLKTYFDKFDSNRNDLFTVYTDKSYFSCSTVADVQHSDAKHPQQGSGGKGEPRLNRYGLFSRNLLEVSKFEQRQKSIARGRLDVIHVIKSLPETAHDIATFTLDCYPVPTMTPSLLVITVNGKFWEAQAKVNRNFTRTFVITEGGASHPMILNDELNVRKYKEHKPSGMPAAGTAASSSVSDPGPFSGSFFSSDGPSSSSSQSEFLHLSQRQVDLLNKYRTINSCDMQTAFNALSRNNWDYNRALTSGFREELM